MATIFDIAKKAGVSITTVSRALNGYSDVGEKTRARVIAVARELNYYPSAAARSLQVRRTNTIAFAPLVRQHAESEPFFKEFVGVLALAAFKHDLSLLALVADSPAETEEVYREVAGTGRVDGIILADVRPEDDRIALLQAIGIPFVAFGRTLNYADLSYPFVDVDGAAGIRAIMDHLYERGHQRIAYLSSPFNTFYALDRYRGFSQSLIDRDLPVDSRLVSHELQQPEEVAAAVAQLLALPAADQPTAFVTDGDRLAVAVLAALEHAGITAGGARGQVAVTGFDDLPFAAFLRPPLTTVRQPIAAACETLLSLLITRTKGKENGAPVADEPGVVRLGPEQILLEPDLVIRGSA